MSISFTCYSITRQLLSDKSAITRHTNNACDLFVQAVVSAGMKMILIGSYSAIAKSVTAYLQNLFLNELKPIQTQPHTHTIVLHY